jgi:O-antigen/teichoic acid export membrane protein
MAAIMAAGEPIVWLILSAKFLAVAPLLLLFVPAELMRILAETMGMPLLARRRLKPFTALFAFQSVIFVGAAAFALPYLGLIGGAAAYLLSTTVTAIATFITSRAHFPMKLERRTNVALICGVGLVVAVMACGYVIPFGIRRLLVAAAAIAAWLAWTLRDEGAREALTRLDPRRTGSPPQ